jgi:hypothetical protein
MRIATAIYRTATMEGSSQGTAAAVHGCSSEEVAAGTPVGASFRPTRSSDA